MGKNWRGVLPLFIGVGPEAKPNHQRLLTVWSRQIYSWDPVAFQYLMWEGEQTWEVTVTSIITITLWKWRCVTVKEVFGNKVSLFDWGQKRTWGASIPDKVLDQAKGTPGTPKPNTPFSHICVQAKYPFRPRVLIFHKECLDPQHMQTTKTTRP